MKLSKISNPYVAEDLPVVGVTVVISKKFEGKSWALRAHIHLR
jgi:hypothetical protein